MSESLLAQALAGSGSGGSDLLTTTYGTTSAYGLNVGNSKTVNCGKRILFLIVQSSPAGVDASQTIGVVPGYKALLSYTWAPSSNNSYWYLYVTINGSAFTLNCEGNRENGGSASGGGTYWSNNVPYCALLLNE